MILSPAERGLLADARRATLGTIDPDGRPRLVPVCFVVVDDVLWTPLDEKPKAVADPHALARVRDIEDRPEVTLLVDRWSEDWTDLAWLRLGGRAALVEPPPPPAILDALLGGTRSTRTMISAHATGDPDPGGSGDELVRHQDLT